MWILTRQINEYDQDGEYFVDAWLEKPTAQMLVDAGVYPADTEHVLKGGGRIECEMSGIILQKESEV